MLFQQLLNMGHQKLKSKSVKRISAQHLRILKIKLTIKLNHCLTFRKKCWGQLALKFSFLVDRTSLLVAKKKYLRTNEIQ